MKIIMGLPALLLGSTLLAGAAYAQHKDNNNTNDNGTPSSWHWSSPAPHSTHTPPPPPKSGPNNSGNTHADPGHPTFGGHPNYAGQPPQHTGQNQARWNHVVTFHDRNVAHFNAQDRSMWTHGQWRHTKHHGRNGWWWYTNGAWFFYDEPVYPYPETVSDDYSFDDDYADAPDQSGGYVWYYCNNPPGYYPYVQSCRGPWQPVTPTPPGYNQDPQGGPDSYQDDDDDHGPAPGQPQDQFQDQQGGPPPGYNNNDDDDDQGPPPGYSDQSQQGYGPPPDYSPPPR